MLFSRAFAGVLSLLLIGAAHSADMLETVKSKKEIVIGTEAQFAPFEYLQDGKIVGYGPDLMRLILADMPDVKVKQFDVPFQGILPGLATKRFDFVVTSVTLTKERADKFAFTYLNFHFDRDLQLHHTTKVRAAGTFAGAELEGRATLTAADPHGRPLFPARKFRFTGKRMLVEKP